MPKYRKLHVCTLDSLDIAAMPDDFTRLTWLLLPLIMSRDGTTLDHAHYLRSKLYPLRDDVTTDMVQTAVNWFKDHDMVHAYHAEGRDYLWIPTFAKFQGDTIREGESTFPAPPTHSRPIHEQVTTNSCSQVDAEVDSQVDAEVEQSQSAAAGKVFRAWEQARKTMASPLELEQLGTLLDDYGVDAVLKGIDTSVTANKRERVSLNFLIAILERQKATGDGGGVLVLDPGGVT